ncbi:glycine betaine ABC transporter substrate-binding protein [Halalkalibacter oceani]|uniref:Glycine/betaine ABC transporter n=1 Tax=Halalkalibacter oceani TaxID=1653776 RepID=A0A9X2DQB1_9BACI|nr:glycine betaine ABC transporter substrate-binding protein [Halalkalibacter oceani]MCM3714721.1 glycine/betaine ABC transporter [Halalkalibacter oceani]
MKKNWKHISLAIGVAFSLTLAGCGSSNEDTTSDGADENGQDSAEETAAVGEALNYTITGIDAGAGVMAAAQNAIEEYELDEYELQASSDAAMTSALNEAISNEEAIVVTGWNPHWKFSKYDLKYLDDPKGVFGDAENIHTMARLGLEEDMPEAYQVLDNFHWTEDDMGEIMVAINEGQDPEEAAAEWVENNPDKVAEWTDGVDSVDGETIVLALVAWDSEIASTNMIAKVLEGIGYNVEISPMEGGYMWAAIANGEADAMVAAWLPATHGAYFEDYQDDVIDLGTNLEGAKIGLVVPAYMDIDSIEDLKE